MLVLNISSTCDVLLLNSSQPTIFALDDCLGGTVLVFATAVLECLYIFVSEFLECFLCGYKTYVFVCFYNP